MDRLEGFGERTAGAGPAGCFRRSANGRRRSLAGFPSAIGFTGATSAKWPGTVTRDERNNISPESGAFRPPQRPPNALLGSWCMFWNFANSFIRREILESPAITRVCRITPVFTSSMNSCECWQLRHFLAGHLTYPRRNHRFQATAARRLVGTREFRTPRAKFATTSAVFALPAQSSPPGSTATPAGSSVRAGVAVSPERHLACSNVPNSTDDSVENCSLWKEIGRRKRKRL